MNHRDRPIDQLKLPNVYAHGQPEVTTLLAEDFEAWAKARQVTCGHPSPVQGCRVCLGTIKVNDAICWGSEGVNVHPER